MSNKKLILGIESSCDDSCASVVASDGKILSNIVISQHESHSPYAGVVPEIAARGHLDNISKAANAALEDAKIHLQDLDAIAATTGPGLIGAVIVGSVFAQSLANFSGKKFIAINHLEGHVLTARLTHKIAYPYITLLTSGGHCQFIAALGLGRYKILGKTLDDAAGEAFDKLAKMLGLGFPGGPYVEQCAAGGDREKFPFTPPMLSSGGADMSFSGLKTAASLLIKKIKSTNQLTDQAKEDICASYQHAITQSLTTKMRAAISLYERLLAENNISPEIKNFVIAGGVAANQYLRANMQSAAKGAGYNFIAPEQHLCTDNAAMIAWAGHERLAKKITSPIGTAPKARWSLEDITL